MFHSFSYPSTDSNTAKKQMPMSAYISPSKPDYKQKQLFKLQIGTKVNRFATLWNLS